MEQKEVFADSNEQILNFLIINEETKDVLQAFPNYLPYCSFERKKLVQNIRSIIIFRSRLKKKRSLI